MTAPVTPLNTALRKSGGDRWRGRLSVPENCDPAVRRLFEIMNAEMTGLSEVSARAGYRRETISDWRYGRSPNVHAIRAVLNALGYDLAVVRRRSG